MARLAESELVGIDRDVQIAQTDEFLSHGLRYLFPPAFGGETRGVPTAWAAEPLKSQLADVGTQPLVWPHSEGPDRGLALEPVHPTVPILALRDELLHERLALVDALRLGDRRARLLAHDDLKKHYA
jgi:hypothetical protein